MARRTILVDSCVYLRLARRVHPLLDTPFGADGHLLQIIAEFEAEYTKQERLHAIHPWVNDAQYSANRTSPVVLPHELVRRHTDAVRVVDECAWERDIALSRVDISALATALLLECWLATDDVGLRDVALVLEVETIGSVELLRFLVNESRLNTEEAHDVLDYLVSLPDLPASFRHDCARHFPDFGG